ncbi:GLIPR1-like protein 1 [Kryptolebias marmoratus]|uniref:GLIPR1-like protein 1 n=1 Tax=Kryptolebias marmoratus TaxID=37003 RepID=A0A3Q3AJJ1_KRYMA|nr:GLIPR1-like protein 1 [Kryptolebias marmoratus]
MGRAAAALLWAWVSLLWGAETSEKQFIDECVREHNRARSAVSPEASDMLHMTWDEGLAITAGAWARHCDFQHNIYRKDVRRMHPTFPSVGENIWTGSPPSSFNITRAIKAWVDEKQHYDYGSNHCRHVCGHYTQVVWAKTYKVGCAVHVCPDGVKGFTPEEGAIFVCNYAPGGNVIGQQPYRRGSAACSGCGGVCKDRLCYDKERDSEKSYNWSPDWVPRTGHRDSDYWIILVVRSVGVILIFSAAYAVHYFYPDIFCYE